MTHILDYQQPLADYQVGGKFAKQSTMIKAGLPVPKFTCLTRDFFQDVVRPIQSDIRLKLDAINFSSSQSIRDGADWIQQRFAELSLTTQQQNAILGAFDALFSLNSLVSVRASTVGFRAEESEDSVSNPFAGMSESFLYVRRDQILQKVKACWASGFSQESLVYRHSQGMDLMGFAVAVGIQEMVFGTRSFVMFTADPKTAARDKVIIAGYGIGEGVVQERVSVDHYFLNSKNGQVHRSLSHKDSQLGFDEASGSGLIELPVDDPLRDVSCLNDEELQSLSAMGDRIENLFGLPQDIEGTFTASGELVFLQSRPIAIDYHRQLVWSNTNVTESYPGVSSALTYTHAKYFYRVIFRDLYRRLGVHSEEIWTNFEPLDNMIGYLNGRIYYCLTHFYQLHKQSPLFPLFASHWENMIGLRSSFQTHESRSLKALIGKIRTALRFGKGLVTTLLDYQRHDRAMYHYHRWWETRIAPLRGQDLSDRDSLELVNLFHEIWTEVGREWGVTLTTDAYLIPLYGWAEALFKKWELEKNNPGLLSDLLCGDEKLLSVEIILSAVSLAEQVRADDKLQAQFRDLDEQVLWQSLQAGDMNADFTHEVKRHLHRYGDRGLQELKIEQPSLRDTPWVLMRMIKQYAQQDVTVESYRAHEQRVRDQADETLAQLLQPHPRRLQLLQNIMLPRLRRLIRHRENSRYCRSELFGFSKQIFNGLAQYFVQRGVLRDRGDIVHLTQDEIFGYINGMGVTSNLQALADLRRAEFESFQQGETAEQITTLGAVRDNDLGQADTDQDHEGELVGLGSSAGIVRGIATVVDDPNNVTDMGDNRILIARETDPGWLFLMLASKGMVVERGSMLSHTAITGRKFGIPTIVALPNATRRIPDGALIEIDGSSGRVTVIDEQPQQDEAAA